MKPVTMSRALWAILLSLSIAAPAQAAKLLLGNEGTYPPFSILGTDGSLSGLEPDLARAMCERMEAECEIVTMDFSALLPSLISGKIDMIVSPAHSASRTARGNGIHDSRHPQPGRFRGAEGLGQGL